MLSKEKIEFFNSRVGNSLTQLIQDCNIPELQQYALIVNKKSKGAAGEIFEWLVTGERGDNKSKPDFKGFEIKTVSYNEDGTKDKEKMSLTSVSYSTIEDETFETSHVLDKSKIFVVKLTKNKNPLERKFLGFGIIGFNFIF